mmetsp:Transcript_2772/g.6577  ORF Transcript_2772/g.6577 Transcript_2772/m.6577 type:complete len:215 (-) Transcript_2772:113-757(-)
MAPLTMLWRSRRKALVCLRVWTQTRCCALPNRLARRAQTTRHSSARWSRRWARRCAMHWRSGPQTKPWSRRSVGWPSSSESRRPVSPKTEWRPRLAKLQRLCKTLRLRWPRSAAPARTRKRLSQSKRSLWLSFAQPKNAFLSSAERIASLQTGSRRRRPRSSKARQLQQSRTALRCASFQRWNSRRLEARLRHPPAMIGSWALSDTSTRSALRP